MTSAGAVATPTMGVSAALCSVEAAHARQDPIGHATHTEGILLIEMPTPWGESFYKADPGGAISQRIRSIQLDRYYRRQRAGLPLAGPLGGRGVYAIAPDAQWSLPAWRRVLALSRPPGPFARYAVTEYRFPAEDMTPVTMAHNFIEQIGSLDEFVSFRTGRVMPRQLCVCTHGSVDICCAKFGIPIYRQLRQAHGLEAWRTSHFGGHRFAPTVIDFPSGYVWAFLDNHTTERVIRRDGPVAALAGNLRGWCGIEPVVQPLDRQAFIEHGWAWLDYARDGEVLGADPDAGRWRVSLTAISPTGDAVTYVGVVVRTRTLEDAGCGPKHGSYSYPSPEYALESFHIA